MLKKILAVSGKPGLYQFISRGNKMVIVETIDETKKRMPTHSNDKIVSLSDISIYTDDDKEIPLATVFENAKKLYGGKVIDVHHKKASQSEIIEVFGKILPQYDADRVHVSDMRKVIQWYNILINAGLDDFSTKEEEPEAAPEAEPAKTTEPESNTKKKTK